jgi:uncharacterized protein YfdQ (DUF2303 family)
MKPSELLHNPTLQTEAAVTAALALAHRDPSQARITEERANLPPLLIAPHDITLESLERFLPAPLRPQIHIALHTARDLHAYVIAQTQRPAALASLETAKLATGIRQIEDTTHHPVIFADRDSMTIKAYLDYHHAEGPRWLNHTAKVAFKNSHQFERWKKVNGQQMTQEQFALFLDEVINDIAQPAGAEVLSFAENLEATSTQIFKAAVKLASGETNYTFTDARDGDFSTKIIDRFTIGIPIWQGGEKVAIEARLFHRIVDNKDKDGAPNGSKSLRFWFTLRHLDEIIDTLFAEEVTFLRTAFEAIAPIYSGTSPTAPEPLSLGL